MKHRRKVTEVPQPISLADEAVNEEMDDSLEKADTTATSLDAEQDKGVNTPRSGEDSKKLTEFMELCTKLQQRVLDLETTKTTQSMEIKSLKRRVKKLERRKRSRTHRLKRLYKVGLSTRVESFDDEVLGEEDASKPGRIADIYANEDIYMVNVHKDKDMFGVNDSDSDEVIVKDAEMLFDVADDLRGEEVFVSQEVTFKEVKDKGNGKMVEPEPVKKLSKKDQLMLDEELAFKLQAKEEEERIAREKAQQIKEVNIAMKKVNTFVDFRTELVEESSKKVEAEKTQEGSSKRAGDKPEQERSKKQKVEDDKKSEELRNVWKSFQMMRLCNY
nr:hypothetical protein [Tanacetum cinerariifolium]